MSAFPSWFGPPLKRASRTVRLNYNRHINWYMFRRWEISKTPIKKLVELNKDICK